MDAMDRRIARFLALSADFLNVQALAQGTATGPCRAPSAGAARSDKGGANFDQIDGDDDGGIDKKVTPKLPGSGLG
jgi:hypothetical protein